MLDIKHLKVSVNDKKIIDDLHLSVKPGTMHVIMGKNGDGKTTLAHAIAGNPKYEVGGFMYLNNESLNEMSITDRAKKGIFLTFQQPVEILGVSNFSVIKEALQVEDSRELLKEFKVVAESLGLPKDWASRSLNYNASGGEKKKNEMLQLMMLKPKVAILDEIDSGLDVDTIKIISEKIAEMKKAGTAFIVISHYLEFIKSINPDYVHVIKNGSIFRTGGVELANTITEKGFDYV